MSKRFKSRKTTLRRLLASRENGRLSQGPTTPEGKERSKFNALQHGLAAKTLVLSNESPDRFRQLLDDLVATYQPVGPEQYHCVQEMAAARWYTWRAHSVLTALADHTMDAAAPTLDRQYTQLDQPTRLALATSTLAATPVLHEVHRTMVRSSRLFDRHFHHLQRLKHELENDPDFSPDPPPNPLPPEPLTADPSDQNPQAEESRKPQTGGSTTPSDSAESGASLNSNGGGQ